MKTPKNADNIKYLRIDFSGSGYTAALDNRVRAAFCEDGIEAVVRGQRTPASGPELWMEIVIAAGSGLMADLLKDAIKYVVSKVRGVVAEKSPYGCCVNSIAVEDFDCDFVIKANSAAGVVYDNIDFTNLFSEMRGLVDSEKGSGRSVFKVEAPCEADYTQEGFCVRNVGMGNYSLWLLSYREGERYPFQLYDAVNKTFIPLGDRYAIEAALSSTDAFYSEK